MSIELKGGFRTHDFRLGRLPQFDARSRNFRAIDRLKVSQSSPKGKSWYITEILDQGDSAACTGFSRTYDLLSSPVRVRGLKGDFAYSLYNLARALDEWPGENYEGSSVLGAIKAAQQLGYVGEYRWAFGIDDLLLAVSHLGPVVVGTDWLFSMLVPFPNGVVAVDPSTGNAGGHAYIIRGIIVNDVYKKFVLSGGSAVRKGVPLLRLRNSWGPDWGVKGEALIWADDLEVLLKGVEYPGEAAVTTIAFDKPRLT